jgi:hypothetical protein
MATPTAIFPIMGTGHISFLSERLVSIGLPAGRATYKTEPTARSRTYFSFTFDVTRKNAIGRLQHNAKLGWVLHAHV